ncbi:Carbonic anhydrase [Heracleum sosnowskyi]|uniref:Carbonic anhydrase n=1 Tax=Heracleum sosnowskyi TaxID=360622 RepID=A0AAD8MYJ2_9APIA|nr:Carbonic anhydrase [Heracleum sosnowskyi]
MKIKCSITLLSTFSLLLLNATSLIVAQEVENEAEFEYKEESKKAPKFWGELKKEWEACTVTGTQNQSPIDISDNNVLVSAEFGKLIKDYKPADAEIKNRGHDIMIHWIGNPGKVKIDGIDYALQQCHWHSPSEHSINGKRYDMEMHMVHKDKNDKVAVIAQLYKIGAKPDTFLSKFGIDIISLVDKHGNSSFGKLDPKEIQMTGRNYYKYLGSLTVPPCTQGVTWIVNQELETVSEDQVKLLRDAVHDFAEKNARPVQPLYGRKIWLYRQNAKTELVSGSNASKTDEPRVCRGVCMANATT